MGSLKGQNFEASVNKDTVYLGNSYQLSISLNNLEGEIDLPNLDDLGQVFGPSSQISSQYINGISSSQKSYTYIIKPYEVDRYIIPSISLYTRDSLFTTDILSIVVIDNPDGIIDEQPSNDSFLFNHFFKSKPPKQHIDPPKKTSPSKLSKKLKKI